MERETEHAAERALLLTLIDEEYDHQAWHGPNLKGSIRGVTPEQATWRPQPGRRNIGEIVVHCAYWKYVVRRRIRGDRRRSFPLKGSNWFKVPSRLTKGEWCEFVQLLGDEHRQLCEAVEDARWAEFRNSGKEAAPTAGHVHGAAMHDVYHAGQIQTIKALYKQARSN